MLGARPASKAVGPARFVRSPLTARWRVTAPPRRWSERCAGRAARVANEVVRCSSDDPGCRSVTAERHCRVPG